MAAIKLIALDVDGVLTDGGFWWGSDHEEWKRFSFADVMGVSLAQKAGLIVALISGEDSPLVDRFASKLKIPDVRKNCKDKAEALRSLASKYSLTLMEVCYMGDDVNDLPALGLAGLSAAPADAQPAVLQEVDLVTGNRAGHGAVRELINAILAGQIVPRC